MGGGGGVGGRGSFLALGSFGEFWLQEFGLWGVEQKGVYWVQALARNPKP